jgi:thiol-disulfide isomerase/thioredoxin
MSVTVPLGVEGELPSFGGATEWLNSGPLEASTLRGKPVVVNFWTYSCINWIRQLPYVRAWAERYDGDGLVVIGVHTPEFSFEHDIENIRRAAEVMQVRYPIAVDSDYAIWRAFDNQYWPALYFADAQGRIRHHHFGEGDYERSELVVRQLLEEAGIRGGGEGSSAVDAGGVEAGADWDALGSPETYVGYARAERLASTSDPVLDRSHTYAAPASLGLNQWALSGDWMLGSEAAELSGAEGRIAYRFQARDVNLVLGSIDRANPVRLRVLVDGRPPGAAHGVDVDEEGNGAVVEPRLYQLVRQPLPVAEHTLEVTFLDPGAQAYVFTFG